MTPPLWEDDGWVSDEDEQRARKMVENFTAKELGEVARESNDVPTLIDIERALTIQRDRELAKLETYLTLTDAYEKSGREIGPAREQTRSAGGDTFGIGIGL